MACLFVVLLASWLAAIWMAKPQLKVFGILAFGFGLLVVRKVTFPVTMLEARQVVELSPIGNGKIPCEVLDL